MQKSLELEKEAKELKKKVKGGVKKRSYYLRIYSFNYIIGNGRVYEGIFPPLILLQS